MKKKKISDPQKVGKRHPFVLKTSIYTNTIKNNLRFLSIHTAGLPYKSLTPSTILTSYFCRNSQETESTKKKSPNSFFFFLFCPVVIGRKPWEKSLDGRRAFSGVGLLACHSRKRNC
ncbi:hypothetical protein CEXT_23101 [Caerostris extrusa]|uniref:Uncharacterized protein n=1 Tax=Caerostris extrusa TaxID=172846 RepID=A0AAV4N3V0_CAEEX|nr:hypothetical protein CEXT_23101 [Caerostris extrusa]